MTIGNALNFIERGQRDSQLRERLNTVTNLMELETIMTDENLQFSSYEFEEAFNLRLVKCQEAEEAEQLQAFKMWWTLLHKFLGLPPDQPSLSHSDPYM